MITDKDLDALAEQRYRYETGLDDMPITKQRFQSRIDALRKAFISGYKASSESKEEDAADAILFAEWIDDKVYIREQDGIWHPFSVKPATEFYTTQELYKIYQEYKTQKQ
jgi:hypothetical protein